MLDVLHAQLVIVKRHRLTSCDSDLQILLDSLSCDEPAGGEETECIKLLAASKTASMVGNASCRRIRVLQ